MDDARRFYDIFAEEIYRRFGFCYLPWERIPYSAKEHWCVAWQIAVRGHDTFNPKKASVEVQKLEEENSIDKARIRSLETLLHKKEIKELQLESEVKRLQRALKRDQKWKRKPAAPVTCGGVRTVHFLSLEPFETMLTMSDYREEVEAACDLPFIEQMEEVPSMLPPPGSRAGQKLLKGWKISQQDTEEVGV